MKIARSEITNILYSRMFKGAFGEENQNIVHETVNLFRADNGNHYLYIPPYGKVNESEKFSHVIVMSDAGSNKTKVQYIAEISVCDALNSGNLIYGGNKLYDIFADNFYNGEKDNQTTFMTYKTNKIYRPAKDIIFTQNIDEKNYNYIHCTKSMCLYHKYLSDNKDKEIIINAICNNEWEDITNDIKTVAEGDVNNNPLIFGEAEKVMADRFISHIKVPNIIKI